MKDFIVTLLFPITFDVMGHKPVTIRFPCFFSMNFSIYSVTS